MFKNFFFGLFVLFGLGLNGQETYTQFETIYLKPDVTQLQMLSKNMKAHNDKYHSKDPHFANVWQVANGPKSGWLVWAMGPCTFEHLDSRPSAGGHDEDWANNVMPYITEFGSTEYWRLNENVSTASGTPQPNLKLRFYEVNNDMGFLLGDIWDKMGKTRAKMPEGRSWSLYNNMFQQGNIGRHFATVTPFANWGELDNGMDLDPSASGTFRKTYESIYGADAWTPFSNMMQAAFSNSWDEIWVLRADMSAPPRED